MTSPRTAHRTLTLGAAFVLAFGAAGVAASAAFAHPSNPAALTAPAASTPDADEATFTLTSTTGGLFALAIVVPGTSVAVNYTVDASGAVTTATTSTTGATVAANEEGLTITLLDGRVVKVELGADGKPTEVDVKKSGEHGDKHDGDVQSPEPKETESPEPKETEVPEAQHTDAPDAQHTDAPDAEHTDAPEAEHSGSGSSGSGGSGSGGSGSGGSGSGSDG